MPMWEIAPKKIEAFQRYLQGTCCTAEVSDTAGHQERFRERRLAGRDQILLFVFQEGSEVFIFAY